MTSIDRHQYILNELKQHGQVSVLELCEALGVSTVTIRKDLKFLENSMLLYRTHGGAAISNPYTKDRTVFEKEKIQPEQKRRIGIKAAALIEENDSVIIASGTTLQAMAREIVPVGHLTVITSALNVALPLIQHFNVEIIQLGGTLRKSSTSVTGIYAEEILKNFFCPKLFLGVDGIDLAYGISTTNAQEAQLNRVMMDCAQQTIVLADSTKFGKKSFGKICPIDKIDILITDTGIPEHVKKELENKGVKVLLA